MRSRDCREVVTAAGGDVQETGQLPLGADWGVRVLFPGDAQNTQEHGVAHLLQSGGRELRLDGALPGLVELPLQHAEVKVQTGHKREVPSCSI